MSVFTRTTALVAGGALLAVPALLVATPAHADKERRGACGTGTYELSVDRDNGGYEVGVDLDNVTAGSTWKVVLKHDGKRFLRVTRTADNEGDLDVERFRDNRQGRDTFRFVATRTDGSGSCSAKVTVR